MDSASTSETAAAPKLSVVVPIYNVEDYLIPCLESLAEQTQKGLEVILVDDGSPDASGAMADEFAAGRPGWSVLHVENGGLGRARNIGMDHSTAEFVAFVDSDDLVPRDAYELMLHAITASGGDIVSGGVLRFDGARTHPSGLHGRAIPETRMATHISQSPSLINDTTAWNKIFRRSFLVEHGLRFPEGMLYEDIPLTLPAHFLARSVDMIEEPVYLWRERQTAEQSITQRRAEIRNLEDRVKALSMVDDFLVRTADAKGKRLHDTKAITVDLPLFLDVLHEGDRAYRERLVEVMGDYLRRVDPKLIGRLIPSRRLAYELIARGRSEELLTAHMAQLRPSERRKVVRQGLRLYADLPFRGDPDVGVPDAVYDVTRTQRLATGIRDVYWADGKLKVSGHAFIDRVPDLGPGFTVHRLQLRRVGDPTDARVSLRTRRERRPDVTAKNTESAANYDGSGFLVDVRAGQLVLPPGQDSAEYELVAQVAAPAARRGASISRPEYGRALHPGREWVGTGVMAVPAYRGRNLRIGVRRVPAVLDGLANDGTALTFSGEIVAGANLDGAWLHCRRADSHGGIGTPLVLSEGRFEGSLELADLEVHQESLSDRAWRLWIVGPGVDPLDADQVDALVSEASTRESEAASSALVEGHYVAPLNLAPGQERLAVLVPGRALVLEQNGLRGARVLDTRRAPVLADFTVDADGITLSGRLAGVEATSLILVSGTNRLELPLTVDEAAGTWQGTIPASGHPGELVLRWLQPGRWSVVLPGERVDDPEIPVRVAGAVEQRFVDSVDVDGGRVRVALRTGPSHSLSLAVDAGGDWADRGRFNQERARLVHYRLARRRPLQDTIFFEAWKGRQYSDSPRAIFEELRRRGDSRRMVWAVENHGVETPPGVQTVVTNSRGYFQEIGRARWVISNDSLPTHFVKREGVRYGQTWHGTPLKRIGFDIENLQMSNRNYLSQFAKEVAKWDALVSPNAFSSEILARAFRYDGPILEIGYPRNDIFFREAEREERARRVRDRLRIPEGKRVVLYAPTWRDNNFNKNGRYQFSMKLDLERMYRAFGDDTVVLIRGHQLVAASVDTSMFPGFAYNVSTYPDISDLYLVADVLITDYSSVMFDFVNTGRPMLFFTYDLESYRDDLRGFYFDFEAEAPGPLLTHTNEVIEALGDLDSVARAHQTRYDAFRQKFAGLEDGGASARFIDRFLGE